MVIVKNKIILLPGNKIINFSFIFSLLFFHILLHCSTIIPVSYTHLDVYKRQIITTAIKRQGRHTHTQFALFLASLMFIFLHLHAFYGKCRNPYQHNACKPKKCPAWIAICFLWIAGQCNCCLLYTSRCV